MSWPRFGIIGLGTMRIVVNKREDRFARDGVDMTRERSDYVGRGQGGSLSALPDEDHKRGSSGCRHRLTWGERVCLIGMGVLVAGIEVVDWLRRQRRQKDARRG